LRKAYTEAAHGILDKIAQRMAVMATLLPAPAAATEVAVSDA
jgi:hypothetical protein